MDKKFAIQTIFLLIAIFIGLFAVFQPQLLGLPSILPGGGLPVSVNTSTSPALSVQQILFIDQASTGNPELLRSILTVDVADTPEKRAQGLSDRESMGVDNGMIFVFDQDSQYNFIMRNMRLSLDFIWVKDDVILDITENVSPDPAGTSDADLKRYTPKVPVNRVIEVNAGYIKKYGIKIGDTLKLENPSVQPTTY